MVYLYQGRYSEAESASEDVITVLDQKLVGIERGHLGIALNNFAGIREKRRNYNEAERLFKQALAVFQEVMKVGRSEVTNNPGIATEVLHCYPATINNLGHLYTIQGRYKEAEPLLKESLRMRKELYGSEHPSVALILSNLAYLYRRAGRLSEAEPLFRQALGMFRKFLGDHPDVAICLNGLAELLYDQRRFNEAERLLQEALQIRKKTLPSQHPDIVKNLNDLGMVFYQQRRFDEAERLIQQALDIDKMTGLFSATAINNLRLIYDARGGGKVR